MSRFDREPQWGIAMTEALGLILVQNPGRKSIISILSDIFVFSYPFFLLWLFFSKTTDGSQMKKKYALTIFFGVIVSMMITLTIQFFADKERPIEQNAQGVITQSMLHDFLPPTSFPSDHATVSFSLAFTCLGLGFFAFRPLVGRGLMYCIVAVIMSFARIMLGLHRPTDIVGGFITGLLGSGIVCVLFFGGFLENFFLFLIKIQQKIFSFLGSEKLHDRFISKKTRDKTKMKKN